MARIYRSAAAAIGSAALLAAAGCATTSLPAPDDEAEALPVLRGVRRVALVRWPEGGERRRDPLDALRDGLAAEGVAATAVEVGPRGRKDLDDVARAVELLRSRLEAAPRVASGAPRVERVDGVDPALERLGVDALAFLLAEEAWAEYAPLGAPRAPAAGAGDPPRRLHRAGTIAVAARGGEVVRFDWWAGAAAAGPRAATTPAEAVDEAVRAIAGGRAAR